MESLSNELFAEICIFLDASDLGRVARSHSCLHEAIATNKLFERLAQVSLGIFDSFSYCTRNTVSKRKRAFRAPFRGSHIKRVKEPNSVAYLALPVRLSKLRSLENPSLGLYAEFEISSNPDSFSLSLVDFDGNGSSSLSFNPETGVLIQETKSTRSGSVYGSFARALPQSNCFASTAQTRVSVFVSRESNIEFFRYDPSSSWERTGSMSTEWVAGDLVTPCIAFRNPGAYRIKLEKYSLCNHPFGHSPIGREPEQLKWKPLELDNTSLNTAL